MARLVLWTLFVWALFSSLACSSGVDPAGPAPSPPEREPPRAGPPNEPAPQVATAWRIFRRGESVRIPFTVSGFSGPVRVRLEVPPVVGTASVPEPTPTTGEFAIDVAKDGPVGSFVGAIVGEDDAGHSVHQRAYFTVRMPIGTVDTTFGSGGRLVVPGVPLTAVHRHFGAGATFLIVAGARAGELVAAALRTDGTFATDFGPAGTGIVAVPHAAGDGPVVVTSKFADQVFLAGGASAIAFARLSVTGFPLGVATATLRDATTTAGVIAIGDRVVACGTTTTTATNDAAFGCAGFVGGALDPTFGNGGTWLRDQAATAERHERAVFAHGADGLTVGGVAANASGTRELAVAIAGADGKGTTTTRTPLPDGALDLVGLASGGATGGMRPRACTFPVYRTAASFVLANDACSLTDARRVAPPPPSGLSSLALVATSRERTVAGSAVTSDGRVHGVLAVMGGDEEDVPDASLTTWITSPATDGDERFAAALDEVASEWVYGVGASKDDGLVMRFWR